MMSYEDAKDLLMGMGLAVSPDDGAVTDGRWYYGRLGRRGFSAPDGALKVALSKMDWNIAYTPRNHALTVGQVRFMGVDQGSPDDPTYVINGDDPKGFSAEKKAPTTIADLSAVFHELFPDADSKMYYDELLETEIVDMSIFGRPEEGVRRFDDSVQSIYYEYVERRLRECGYTGKLPSRQTRDDVLAIHMHDHVRNTFREWVESHEWDGVPRVRTWFRDTMGATAPALAGVGLEERYLGDVAEAWFIGGVKRMYSRTRHEIVPVLIGPQGVGKGLALKYTAGQDRWFKDTNVSMEHPDKFLESIKGHIIVELSESTQLRSKNSELLKAFISEDADQYRKAYARREGVYVRHFILAASSNIDNVFTDITGNRRYFPMYVDVTKATREFSEDRTVGQYDVEQVWAEALYMYRHGGHWYLSSESKRIAREMQDYSTVENVGISVIDEYLDDPANGYTEVGSRITRATIYSEVFHLDPTSLDDRVNGAYRAWVNGQRCWQKISGTVRIGGKPARGYVRVLTPGQVRDVGSLRIVDGKKGDEGLSESERLVELMRRIGRETGIINTGDPFPADGLSAETLDRLMEEGYIYSSGVGKSTRYWLGVMP